MEDFSINSFMLIKGASYGLAVIFIVILLAIMRFSSLQKYTLPLFDEVTKMSAAVRNGKATDGDKIAIGIAHGLGVMAVVVGAAILSGVAH